MKPRGAINGFRIGESRYPSKTPKDYHRPIPSAGALLKAKEAEAKCRERLSSGLAPLEVVEWRMELVKAVEAAGEDPLGEFALLCESVAFVEGLGPAAAWELVDDNIGSLYEDCYFQECRRYCELVVGSEWASRTAKAWALLRIVCMEKLMERTGAFSQLSGELMRGYPETEAAKVHTKAAVTQMVRGLRDIEAMNTLDVMIDMHGEDAAFVVDCVQSSATIALRLGNADRAAKLLDVLDNTMQADLDVALRRKAEWCRNWIEDRLGKREPIALSSEERGRR